MLRCRRKTRPRRGSSREAIQRVRRAVAEAEGARAARAIQTDTTFVQDEKVDGAGGKEESEQVERTQLRDLQELGREQSRSGISFLVVARLSF